MVAGTQEGTGLKKALAYKAGGVKILAEAGIVRPVRPDKLARIAVALSRWGRGPAAGYISSAVDSPGAPAIVDELGTLSFDEVNRRTNALTHSLAAAGVKEGDSVGIMCRNHRGFVEATVAVSKLGADALLLNTAFAGPQLADVVAREDPAALIYDQEFAGLLDEAGRGRACFVAWSDAEGDSGAVVASLEEMIAAGSRETPKAPSRVGKTVILTSGTTGAPKGANRSSPQSLDPAMSLLSKIPLRHGQTSVVAAPLFHSWGFAHFTIGLLLGSTLVLRRRFEPEECLADIQRARADSLVVIPVMMQRILELPDEVRTRFDASSLRVVAASGSALPGDLATNWMDEYGDTLYNLYGSTEVAWATIATPEDMRAAPGTAGRTPRGTVVKLYDERDAPVPTGETGRIFVGNELLFEGYTGGGSKAEIDGLMATGDVGRMDAAGRLFVEGRDDEMIVSGGENVFPKEVEDLLSRHEAIADAAAVGVPDQDFGQRLRAFVVLREGERVDEEALKSYVKANLARYKVPREILFLEELPRNATGKVLKRELKQLDPVDG
jgi:acyl-CoA synthetase (AMP-forming)/AMP-acid ligase II